MADKRMFSLSVISTDLFAEMPVTSRLLYYELGMRADDDGFVGNWKQIMKMAGLSEDDLKVLLAKKFLLMFDNGVIVIRHWRLNNYLRNDRKHPTRYQEELSQLYIDNDVYELESTEKSTMLPSGRQLVDSWYTENSIDKISIDKNSIDDVEENSAIKFYLNNINSTPVSREMEILEGYLKELPEDLLIYGMEKAVEKKARNLQYLKGIWNSWLQKGITTLAEAKDEKPKKQDNKSKTSIYDDIDMDQFYANL